MKIQLRYKPQSHSLPPSRSAQKTGLSTTRNLAEARTDSNHSSSRVLLCAGSPQEAPMPPGAPLYPRRAVGEGSASDAGSCVSYTWK